jgi:N-acetylneuraminic acid mutarotase
LAIVASGNKVFFAGGNNNDTWYDLVDIYDISTGSWTISHLSEPKIGLTAAAIEDKVFFAGGATDEGWDQTNKVDIYDISDHSWSVAELSEGKIGAGTVIAGNKLYFAGGWNYLSGFDNPMIPLKSVDIYDASTDSWSVANLNFVSGGVSGIAQGDKIYWSGISWLQYEGNVEVWNTGNGGITKYCLSYPRSYPGGIVKNNDIAFFVPGKPDEIISDRFDIYDPITDKWSIGLLDHAIAVPAVIKVNNVVYIAGGQTSNGYTNKVYTLSW